jgi:hypothetical protein
MATARFKFSDTNHSKRLTCLIFGEYCFGHSEFVPLSSFFICTFVHQLRGSNAPHHPVRVGYESIKTSHAALRCMRLLDRAFTLKCLFYSGSENDSRSGIMRTSTSYVLS